MGFLLDGGAIQAFEKYVGKEETPSTNHHYHSADAAYNSPWAYRHHIGILSFFHRNLTLLTTTIASWLGQGEMICLSVCVNRRASRSPQQRQHGDLRLDNSVAFV